MPLYCHPSRRQFAEGFLCGSGEPWDIVEDNRCPRDKLYIMDAAHWESTIATVPSSDSERRGFAIPSFEPEPGSGPDTP